MSSTDHHSEYLAEAIAALTPEGRARVNELLDELAEAAGGRERLVRSPSRGGHGATGAAHA